MRFRWQLLPLGFETWPTDGDLSPKPGFRKASFTTVRLDKSSRYLTITIETRFVQSFRLPSYFTAIQH
jgi:hypothetical protein